MVSQIKVDSVLESSSGNGVNIDSVLLKDGKLASGTGNVLQVVQGTDNTSANITATSYTDTGLTASITPSATSSKILIIISQSVFVWGPGAIPFGYFKILRDSTVISGSGDGYPVGMKAYLHGDSNNYKGNSFNASLLDTPSTTSSVTYKTQAKYAGSGSGYVATAYNNTVDSIVLMEIGG